MYAPPETVIYDSSVEDTNACSVDVYHPITTVNSEQSQDLVVFIHGGAWRTGDKSDHADIPALLAQARHQNNPTSTNNAPIIMVPNYRLSYHPDHPERATTVHPTHILDIARFFRWLTTQWGSRQGQAGSSWTTTRNVYLLGHSCGAHILSHIFFCLPTPLAVPAATAPTPPHDLPSLRETLLTVLSKTRGAAFLDGIYDLPTLLSEYPTYGFFVSAAFGADQHQWADAGVLFVPGNGNGNGGRRVPNPAVMRVLQGTRVIVAHATEDELLTPTQGKMWVDHLREVGLGQETVWDGETLRGTHDGCLHHAGLGELLCKMMKEERP